MRTKQEAAALLAGMQTDAEQDRSYDYAADLRELRRQFGKKTAAGYRRYLDELLAKYERWEGSDVHAALVARCRTGDVDAIKLYNDLCGRKSAEENGVTIIDDV